MKKHFLSYFPALKKNHWNALKTVGIYLLYAAFAGFVGISLLFLYYAWNLPQPEKFTETPFIESTKIYDRTGKVLLYDIFGEEKREIVAFDKISDHLKHAVLASEDARFYQHHGIDFEGILRSVYVGVTSRDLLSQGGSTITQQLVRWVYLTRQKLVSRKIKEIILSIELEWRYSKDQIFDWYLNKVPFGENAYGAEAASQTYFNKPASDLTIAEAATLTAILPAPSYYTPYGPHKAALLEKKDVVIDKMMREGFISQDQAQEAKEEKIEFAEETNSIKAPHFVFSVKKYLDEKYGEDYLKEKGLRVYTTLDWELQELVEKTIKDNEAALLAKRANNAAVTVIDPQTGELLALMGSKDYFADSYPEGCDEKPGSTCLFSPKYDVATIGSRQPGSSFKPIVYAAAFKKGFLPETVVWDVKTEFSPSCDPSASQATDSRGLKCYHPQNYDGRHRGKVSLRNALAGSLNVPAVKTLYLAGIGDSLQMARDLGITTLTDVNNYGLSLVLGGGDINLLELTSAYGVFAADGTYATPLSILRITDAQGNTVEENTPSRIKALDTQVARQITSVLSDNEARSFIFGHNSPLHVPGHEVAVKTGTTQNLVDGWTVGYSSSLAVGVWIGNNNNEPTRDSGVGLAAPIWNSIITKALERYPGQAFTQPTQVTDRSPAILGQLPASDGNTILYYVNKDNPLGGAPQNPANDPQYPLWQIGINYWLVGQATIPEPEPEPSPEPADPIIPNLFQ